jgi:benzodiazapine receptor
MRTSHSMHLRHTHSRHEAHQTSRFQTAKFVSSILICIAASYIGYVFTNESVKHWYTTLIKPELNPPAWVFGPVWTVLYLMMGVSLYLMRLQYYSKSISTAIIFFYVQLFFNVLWSYTFFAIQSPYYGMINIFYLWLMIIITVFLFFRESKAAGCLMVPYLLWVSYASYLNFSIWLLNP